MSKDRTRLVGQFLNAVAAGTLPDDICAPDMVFWSVNSGASDRARFLGGVQALSAIFGGTLVYDVESVTSEADRTVAEVSSHGTLNNGESFSNTHVFLFTLRDGRIVAVKEYMNQFVVRDKLVPLLQAAMANRAG